uniref:Voltage-gated hydrogen channel 1 n=1 Tax=Amphimedon queenslandica TaxID=400682 RepID=A0A1X7UV59_AMPQE
MAANFYPGKARACPGPNTPMLFNPCNELFLQVHYCHYIEDPDYCGPTPDLILDGANLTEGNGSTYCHCVYRLGKTICADHNESKGVKVGLVLHIISICILTTFLFEIVLKLIAFRLKYFTHKFEVFDGIIVVISWILDIAS